MTLDHLERLHDTVQTPDGETLHFWWIYAEPTGEYESQPPADATYEMVYASDEGVACVDDVARIAVAYLRHYQQFGDDHSRVRARQALEFVRYMQLESGKFLNFITKPALTEEVFGSEDPDVVEGIRVNGSQTSAPSVGWWACRACWALGVGYRVFVDEDPEYAGELAADVEALMDAWAAGPLEEYGEYETLHGRRVPKWLPASGTDATAPAVLGLATFVEAGGGGRRARRQLRRFSEGVAAYQFGDSDEYPFDAHLPWTGSVGLWHAWGARQSAALARAGRVLGESTFVESARDEVTALFTHLLASYTQIKGFYPAPVLYNQISYGANALVQGCVELARATDDRHYRRLAGLFATWYTGNNVAGAEMYDSTTGRGFDGIRAAADVNWNAGAESTVCAVLTMLDAAMHSQSASLLDLDGTTAADPFTTVEAESGTVNADASVESGGWTGEALVSGGRYVELRPGGAVTLDGGPDVGAYRPYVVLERDEFDPDGVLSVEVGDAAAQLTVGDAGSEYFWMESAEAFDFDHGDAVTLRYDGPSGTSVDVDAVVFQPVVEFRVAGDGDHERWGVVRNVVDEARSRSVPVDVDGRVRVTVRRFDADGRSSGVTNEVYRDGVSSVTVGVEPLGYTLLSVRSLVSS
ncbi:hypothetical protein [Halomicrococcus sp. SG-WS-1]|uniref:hypothetical protein n=1 Tax=Halomicrococcus sp. SG-WS-1 TaxID=3439057 RepID=UPI003F7AA945